MKKKAKEEEERGVEGEVVRVEEEVVRVEKGEEYCKYGGGKAGEEREEGGEEGSDGDYSGGVLRRGSRRRMEGQWSEEEEVARREGVEGTVSEDTLFT